MNKTSTNSVRDRIVSPHAEAIISIFKKRFKKQKSALSIETMRNIAYSFVEHTIRNTAVYTSARFSAAFPYTIISVSKLAKEIFACYKELPSMKLISPSQPKKKEFVFGSFLNTGSGGQFTFFEEAMHQFIKRLPRYLSLIQGHCEPDEVKVYIVGSPTNELGSVSDRFAENIKNGNTFHLFGRLYAEFVESCLPVQDKDLEQLHLYLYGISMGGSFATEVAQQLLASKKVTQSREIQMNKHLPFTQVRTDTLPGASNSRFKSWQIPLGFILDGIFTLPTNAYTRVAVLKEGKSSAAINNVLAERGIVPDMTVQQKKLKNKIIKGEGLLSGEGGVLNDLRKGVPISKSLKFTEVRALYDPLQYSSSFRRMVEQQRLKFTGSLGYNYLSVSKIHRRAAINQAHTLVFFRENELRRMECAAAAIEQLERSVTTTTQTY